MIKEAQLIKLAQSGNSTAFGKLVNRYWNKVFLLTTKYCKLEEDKEDIVQETFIQAWQNIKRFQRNSTFFFWLCKIALNLIYEKRRKERFKTISLHSLPPDYGVHYRKIERLFSFMQNRLFYPLKDVKELSEANEILEEWREWYNQLPE